MNSAGRVVDVALYEAVFDDGNGAGFNVMPGITPVQHPHQPATAATSSSAATATIFRRLMRAIGRPDLADDPQLASNAGRDARAAELYAAIDAWVAAHDGDAVLAAMEAPRCQASAIYRWPTCSGTPSLPARGMFEAATLPGRHADPPPGHRPQVI